MRAFSLITGTHLTLESGLEHDLVRVLDRDAGVRWLVPQPLRLTWAGAKRKPKPHIPDLLSVDTEGNVTVWDVRRPTMSTADDFLKVRAIIEAACEQVGWHYEVFTGLSPVHRHNLLWLHGYRARPACRDDCERELVERAAAGCTLHDLLGDADVECRAVVWHLIWSGHISVDLASPLTSATRVAS